MTLTPFLAASVHGDGTTGVKLESYVDGTVTQRGVIDNTGSPFRNFDNGHYERHKACWWRGAYYVLGSHDHGLTDSVVSARVARSTDGGSTWTNVHEVTHNGNAAACTSDQNSGLRVAVVNYVPVICFIYLDSSTFPMRYYVAYSLDGTSWSEIGPLAVLLDGDKNPSGPIWFGDAIWHRGKLYASICSAIDEGVLVFDPTAGTLTNTTGLVGMDVGFVPPALAEAWGDLYTVGTHAVYDDCGNFVSGAVTLWKLSGTAWSQVATLDTSSGASSANVSLGLELVYHADHLYCFYTNTSFAYFLKRVSSGLVVVDQTADLPAWSADGAQLRALLDFPAAAGSDPALYVARVLSGGAGTFDVWKHNGDGVAMTQEGSTSGSGAYWRSYGDSKEGAGDGFYATARIDVDANGIYVSGTDVQIPFEAYGGGTVNVRGWYATATDGYLVHAMTLVGAVSSVAADGTTMHVVTWHAGTDGLVANDVFKAVLECY